MAEWMNSEWLNAHQPLIAAIIALSGLIGGALLNAHLARRRDTLLRRQESRAMAAILAGEIKAISSHAALFTRELKRVKSQLSQVSGATPSEGISVFPSTDIAFERMIDKVGLLPTSLVIKVADFYFDYQIVKKYFDTTTKDSHRDTVANFVSMIPMMTRGLDKAVSKGESLVNELLWYAEGRPPGPRRASSKAA